MSQESERHTTSAYKQTQEELAASLKEAYFNSESFLRPLAACEISSCQGMCCYDGVYVNQEEEQVLTRLAKEKSEFFQRVGAKVPEEPVVDAIWRGALNGRKTAVAPRNFNEQISEFPSHFDNTACVFLTPEGRCSLQMLAEEEKLNRWHYKPTVCVAHPIHLSTKDNTIYLPDEATDPNMLSDYPGYTSVTQCGKSRSCGKPAHEVLEGELRYLSQILGRDLLAEIEQAKQIAEQRAPHSA